MIKIIFSTLCCFALASCSSSSSTSDSEANTVLTGVFLDSEVQGLSYETETLSGVTNESGEFQYLDGESVTFSIGDLVFPTITAAETVTPADMTESGDIYDNLVLNATTLLQSLDVDADPTNGINISDQAAANATAIDLSMEPANFSQESTVLNLVANSGSSNTSLISTEEASQHFQRTLVSNGSMRSFTKLEYTNLVVENTAVFASGSSIYYRPDGVKFSRRLGGEEFQGMWWLDADGLICEDIRGGLSTYCITDAENYLLTKSAELEMYNYSETGFISSLTITAGDTLGLSSNTPNIVGDWRLTYDDGCFETLSFAADGSIRIVDLGEIQTGVYSVGDLIDGSRRRSLDIEIQADNQEPGCDGETNSSAGTTFMFFLEIDGNTARYYASADATDPILQLTKNL